MGHVIMVILQDDGSKPSMLEKSLERRRVNREHNSNFRAGHVAVHEAHLHKTGLRGRKGYLAVCFLLCLILFAAINFLLTLWILFGVQINRHGSNLFDFLVDGSLRFKVPVDVGSLQFLEAGILGGFLDKDLYLHSTDGNVTFQQGSFTKGPKVTVSNRETIVKGARFEVINPHTGRTVFNAEDMKKLRFMSGTKVISDGGIEVSKIVSPTGKGLQLHSKESIEFQGKEGSALRAKRMTLSGRDILLAGTSTITLNSRSSSGITFNTSLLPKLSEVSENSRENSEVYRLCLCGRNGRLFGARVMADTLHPCQELEESFSLCN